MLQWADFLEGEELCPFLPPFAIPETRNRKDQEFGAEGICMLP
jgi:hypothetical protein